MPEGHAIHRLARDHGRLLVGQRLAVSSPQGRFRIGARQLDGRRLEGVEAYGKHLFYTWRGGDVLHVHLGLYGRFRLHAVPAPEPRGAVRMRAVGDDVAIDLNGPTACDVLDGAGRDRIVSRLGQDPLRSDARPEVARNRILGSRATIGRLLLDQSVIAGVGNIFRTEALFLTGLHPERIGNTLHDADFDALWSSLETMLRVGVRYDRIITTDPDEIGRPRSRMQRGERLNIYGKERCPRCAGPIRSWEVGSRVVHACLRCQPRRRRRRPASSTRGS
ncbi:MAG: Fpg/Nei family DNA glycosylase [Planctomycetota bacterium]